MSRPATSEAKSQDIRRILDEIVSFRLTVREIQAFLLKM